MVEVNRRRHFGDRKDAWLVTDLDPMHNIMNYMMGNRTENEAVSTFEIDITNLNKYLEEKNKGLDKNKYTFFHVVLAALARTIKERKCMNYFIRNKKFYERKIISLCFTAKKAKVDGAEETIVIQEYHPESNTSPVQQIHDKVLKELDTFRGTESGSTATGDAINKYLRLPGFILSPVMAIIRFLDKHGRLPYNLFKLIPYSATVFVSNLGSIKFNATYHHLINFGTNSLFMLIGSKHFLPVYSKEGTCEMKEFLPISVTIDERIADGVYFANSLKLFQALLLRPELLDKPANEEIDFKKLLNEVYGENK